MKRVLTFIIALGLAAGASGQSLVERPGTYLTDTTGTLSPAEVAGLETLLRDYEQRTTNEVAVLIVPTLGGTTVEDYATQIFHGWGIGKKAKDNGVLFLWSTGDRKVRIEVGYGLEPALPDGRAGQIIRDSILPAFKAQRWYEGVRGGVTAVITQLDAQAKSGNVAPARAEVPADYTTFWIVLGLFGGSVLGFFAYVWFGREEETPGVEPAVKFLTGGPDTWNYHPTPRPRDLYVRSTPDVPIVAVAAVEVTETEEDRRRKKHQREEDERRRKRQRDDEEESSRRSSYSSSNYSSPSHSDYSGGGSSFGGFGGGDSGGGGASGSY